jgi:hypothetical protein
MQGLLEIDKSDEGGCKMSHDLPIDDFSTYLIGKISLLILLLLLLLAISAAPAI